MALALACFFAAVSSLAQPIDGGLVDASPPIEAGPDLVTEQLTKTATHVRELVAGELGPTIEPRSLFDIDLDDPEAATVERTRLEALIRAVAPDAGKAAKPVDAGVRSPRLLARLELDRARLAFFELPAEARAERLESHRARVAAAKVVPAPDREEEAEIERRRALEAAQLARSEAERVVSEEYARLLSIETQQAVFARRLTAAREKMDLDREATLVWERRARELRHGDAPPDVADRTYDELRKALRAARNELDEALREATQGTSTVPTAGDDPLASLQLNVDTTAARAQRDRVVADAAKLVKEEHDLQDERAAQLLDQVDRLNAERLGLLTHLSAPKHGGIIGFTSDGLDQAAAEIRQLSLIARYHRFVASRWVAAARQGRGPAGLSPGAVAVVVLEWIAVLVVFSWLRSRAPVYLGLAWKRARAEDRRLRLPHPSLATRLAGFVVQTHRPVFWLVLSVVLAQLLPPSARDLLEVRLLSIAVEWIFGGALVVASVNALAGVGTGEKGAPVLRLRSLRLVGGVVVAFGLVLALTSRLVGPGTIYRWVLSSCWVASIPVFLVLVRWWRETVFERAERTRNKSVFEVWILAHRRGWKSLIAATAGAVFLFVRGVWRFFRGWIGSFALTRSVLAYLFRRELGKLEAHRADLVSERIADTSFDALGPERASAERVGIDADDELSRLEERLRERKGGVVAIVGELGMGKSTSLERLRKASPGALSLDVPLDADVSFAATVTAALGDANVVLLDDAQHLVRPMMGGLAAFDALLAAAGQGPATTTWVLAIDDVLWLFLLRARGSRPLFDEVIHLYPWREEQLVELIEQRTGAAGLDPSFEYLLDRLPAKADEIDRQEALEERAASYYRLLWDYAGGNPGIALHMWRRVLGVDAEKQIHVRFFQAPNAAELEPLPDQTIFVLRAVMQLGRARKDDIAAMTMLHHADVLDALRFGVARGFLKIVSERYAITWTWQRAIAVFLQRRHLLVRS